MKIPSKTHAQAKKEAQAAAKAKAQVARDKKGRFLSSVIMAAMADQMDV